MPQRKESLTRKNIVPVAKVADAEVNVPVWQKTIELIVPKVMKIVAKGKNLNIVLPLMTNLLTVSKKEYFLKSWPSLVEVKYPEYGNEELITYLLKSSFDIVKTSSDSTTADSQLGGVVQFEEISNAHRFYIAFRAFILILRDVEQSIGGDKEGLTGNTAGAVSAVQSKSGLVLVEGKLNLLKPRFPDFVHDSLEYLENPDSFNLLSKIGIRAGGNNESISEYSDSLNLPLSLNCLERMGSSMQETLKLVNHYAGQALRDLEKYYQGDKLMTEPISSSFGGGTGSMYGGPGTQLNTSASGNSGTRSSVNSLTSVAGIRRSSLPGLSDTLNGFTGLPNRHDTISNIEYSGDSKSKRPETFEQVYVRLLQTIIESIPRFCPTGISAIQLVEMLTKYATLHYDRRIQQCAFEAICRISKVKRFDSQTKSWELSPDQKEMMSASVFRIFNDSAFKFLKSRFAEMWITTEKFESGLLLIGTRILILLDIWLEDITTSMVYTATRGEIDTISLNIEAQGLFYLCCVSSALRKIGISILKKSMEFRKALVMKLPLSSEPSSLEVPLRSTSASFERLSIFHGGKRASMYQERASRVGDSVPDSEMPYLSIYEIMTDQGELIVREHYLKFVETSSSLTSTSKGSERLAQHKANYSALVALEHPLVHVAESSNLDHQIVWEKCFTPLLQCLIEFAYRNCMKKALLIIWGFLEVMQPVIHMVAEEVTIYRTGYLPTLKKFEKLSGTVSTVTVQSFIDYWKGFTSFAYVCFEVYQAPNDDPTLFALDAKPFLVVSPGELNRNVLPLLSSSKYQVRKAAVSSVGCVQPTGYQALLRDIEPYIQAVVSDAQQTNKLQTAVFENAFERMRTQLAHLLTFIAAFTKVESFRKQDLAMKLFHNYIRAMIRFLSAHEVQLEWKHQITRFYFCTLIEKYYKYLVQELANSPDEKMQDYFEFNTRKELFSLFEGWCGIGIDGAKSRLREANMMAAFLENTTDIPDRGSISNKMEIHRKSIQMASLQAMASLCRGPLSSPLDMQAVLDVTRIISWINGLLEANQSQFHSIARSAIQNILESNFSNDYLVTEIISNCYNHPNTSNLTSGYFLGLVSLIGRGTAKDFSVGKMACLALFHLGNSSLSMRKGAAALLLAVEKVIGIGTVEDETGEKTTSSWYSGLGNSFDVNIDIEDEISGPAQLDSAPKDISKLPGNFRDAAFISDLPTVYKNARIEAAQKLAKAVPGLSMDVLYEITLRIQALKALTEEDQKKIKGLLAILPPWVSNIKIDGTFSADPVDAHQENKVSDTWTALYNLFFITARCSTTDIFTDDIENLWNSLLSFGVERETLSYMEVQKLAKKRITTIIDFLAVNILALQSSRAIAVAKNIAVVISRTEFGATLVDHIISKVSPKSVIPIADSAMKSITSQSMRSSKDSDNSANSSNQNTAKYSSCFLYLVQLIDVALVVDRYSFVLHLPLLLNVTLTQLDARTLVCEEMRTLCVYLIQSIFLREKLAPKIRKRVNAILMALNMKEGKSVWKYEDTLPGNSELDSIGQLTAIAQEMLDLFSLVYPNLQEDWGLVSAEWGSSCPDIHIACRSLQLYRAINPKINTGVLSQIIQSLSLTVSDARTVSQHHSLDLLLTLDQIVRNCSSSEILDKYPQLFWVSLGLMSSVLEWEYLQGLKILNYILRTIDLSSNRIINLLMSTIPSKWPGGFSGVFVPLSRGLSSSLTAPLAIDLINSLLFVSVPQFLDSRPSKYLFIALANLPQVLHPYDYESGMNDLFDKSHAVIKASLQTAELIASVCISGGCQPLGHLLSLFAKSKIRKRTDFFRQLASLIKDEFRDVEGQVVKFCISLLTNSDDLYPNCYLSVLECLWLDPTPRPNLLALPADLSGAWLRPLIALLELESSKGHKVAKLLNVMLSSRLKAAESEIITNVGGAQNVYAFVNRNRVESKSFLGTGWFMEELEGHGSALTKKRVFTVSNSFGPSLSFPVLSIGNGRSFSRSGGKGMQQAILQFSELESFFKA